MQLNRGLVQVQRESSVQTTNGFMARFINVCEILQIPTLAHLRKGRVPVTRVLSVADAFGVRLKPQKFKAKRQFPRIDVLSASKVRLLSCRPENNWQ